MDEHRIVRGMLLRIGRGVPRRRRSRSGAHLGAAACRLADRPRVEQAALGGAARGVAAARTPDERRPHALQLSDELGRLLALEPFDAELLALMVAGDRLPRVAALARIAIQHGHDLPALLGELAGAEPNEAERAVRRSPVLRLGLVRFAANRQGRSRSTSTGR
jgi:hypothetical protein